MPDFNEIVERMETTEKMDSQIQQMMYEELLSIYQQQRLQDCKAFNLAYSLSIIGAIIGIASVVLLFSGKVSEGAFTATGGGMYTIVSNSWRKLTKDTDDSLEKSARALEDKLSKNNCTWRGGCRGN